MKELYFIVVLGLGWLSFLFLTRKYLEVVKGVKIIKTRDFLNKCDCKRTVQIIRYMEVPDTSEEMKEVLQKEINKEKALFLGLCECGNIFIT